ncbi:MAG TPA: hypothetical protein PLA18_01200 [Deltaproteobacteria bacterium]|nr:hypothetical protein [Deltaproteobacteria bacterium]
MARFEIHTVNENCSGCLRCELACSDLSAERFSLSEARIHVDLDKARCTISFSPECRGCGTCADHCLYGALIKMPKGNEK